MCFEVGKCKAFQFISLLLVYMTPWHLPPHSLAEENAQFSVTGAFDAAVPAFQVNDEEISLASVPLNSP